MEGSCLSPPGTGQAGRQCFGHHHHHVGSPKWRPRVQPSLARRCDRPFGLHRGPWWLRGPMGDKATSVSHRHCQLWGGRRFIEVFCEINRHKLKRSCSAAEELLQSYLNDSSHVRRFKWTPGPASGSISALLGHPWAVSVVAGWGQGQGTWQCFTHCCKCPKKAPCNPHTQQVSQSCLQSQLLALQAAWIPLKKKIKRVRWRGENKKGAGRRKMRKSLHWLQHLYHT